jgi:hypothetical protein
MSNILLWVLFLINNGEDNQCCGSNESPSKEPYFSPKLPTPSLVLLRVLSGEECILFLLLVCLVGGRPSVKEWFVAASHDVTIRYVLGSSLIERSWALKRVQRWRPQS